MAYTAYRFGQWYSDEDDEEVFQQETNTAADVEKADDAKTAAMDGDNNTTIA